MRVRVLAPARVIVDREAGKVIARSREGYFCLLPRHVDFVSELAPGLLALTGSDGGTLMLAADEGVLVKIGSEVLVATRNARAAGTGEILDAAAARELLRPDEDEVRCREIIAGLEAASTKMSGLAPSETEERD